MSEDGVASRRCEEDLWRPFTQMQTALPHQKVVSANGALLNLASGKTIIDAISSWWVITHGHCQREIVDAIRLQAEQLDQVLFANFSHESAQSLAKLLTGFLPEALNKLFFSDNGSTAVEVAIKMALQYWKHVGKPQKQQFLAFERSYHGDTVGAMSLGGHSIFTAPYKELLFETQQLRQGHYLSDSPQKFLSHLEEVLHERHGEIAAIIMEPLIQGAGGMIVWPKGTVERAVRLAQKHEVLVIFDEVMTGFGRTGTLFACDQLSIVPDFLCLSKGLTGGHLPMAVTVTSPTVYDAFLSTEKSKMFFHGHSFSGNAIACAAAVANLELIQKRDYGSRWRDIEQIHRERSSALGEGNKIRDRRVYGTIGVVELVDKEGGYGSYLAERFTQYAMEKGVFLRPLGNTVYVLPPYSITDEQLHKTWDVIESGIRQLV